MNTLKPYIITRNYDSTEWSMTELTDDVDQRRPSIYIDVDGSSMRRILSFDAPSWEDARKVMEWSFEHLRRKSVDEHLLWDEARILLQQENLHAFLAKTKADPSRSRKV